MTDGYWVGARYWGCWCEECMYEQNTYKQLQHMKSEREQAIDHATDYSSTWKDAVNEQYQQALRQEAERKAQKARAEAEAYAMGASSDYPIVKTPYVGVYMQRDIDRAKEEKAKAEQAEADRILEAGKPPAWDPLGVAPFAWDLPEPGPPPAPALSRGKRLKTVLTLRYLSLTYLFALTVWTSLGLWQVFVHHGPLFLRIGDLVVGGLYALLLKRQWRQESRERNKKLAIERANNRKPNDEDTLPGWMI